MSSSEDRPFQNLEENIATEDVYDFYRNELFPSIMASLPILFKRIGNDLYGIIGPTWEKTTTFLIPSLHKNSISLPSLWNQTVLGIKHPNFPHSPSALVDFIFRHVDANNDGMINQQEILNLKEKLREIFPDGYLSGIHVNWSWWNAWPMMDLKIGVFLWRTCGGFLLVFAILTIIPGKMHALGKKFIRWPILAFTYTIITAELIAYAVLRLFIRFMEAMFGTSKHRKLRWKMTQAKSYDEWYSTAKALDISQGRDKWIETIGDEASNNYNWGFIKELMTELRIARRTNDSIMALAVLQQCTRKNVGGIMSYEIFSYTNTSEPKKLVKEFINEVETTLRWVTHQAQSIPISDRSANLMENVEESMKYNEKLHSKAEEEKHKLIKSVLDWAITILMGNNDEDKTGDEKSTDEQLSDNSVSTHSSTKSGTSEAQRKLPPIHREKVIIFLKRARAAYGRTCLCLSGGAMMGCYHFGVVKALFEQNALPHIISGTSAGSAIAAMLCTRTDDEIRRDLTPEKVAPRLTVFSKSLSERIKNVYKHRSLFDSETWIELMQWFTLGNMTFEEAYRKTGKILCVTISSPTKKSPPVLINYINAPDVVIATACVASAAVPGFINPVRLKVKDSNGNIRYQALHKDELYWDGSIEQDIPITGLSEMFNCQFFLTSQCNPHVVPFFYSSKGDVGRPSRWSRDNSSDSWRGGFLLSAIELYLKSDMRAKFHFLNDIEVALGFTSTMWTQVFHGTTTIVPQVKFTDYFKLFSDASLHDMQNYFQVGSVAAYHHIIMIKLHYRIVNTLNECLAVLEERDKNKMTQMRSMISKEGNSNKKTDFENNQTQKETGLIEDIDLKESIPQICVLQSITTSLES